MKKVKVLRVRSLGSNSHTFPESQDPHDPVIADAEQTISEESVKIRPIRVGINGFASWIRRIRPTTDGMESEVEKPLIIMKSGHRVKESEIKGQCDICGGYDSYIFNCYVYGCKKSLCLKHVYFFEYGEKKMPYCLDHYRQAVDEYDTWQEYDNRQR
jgi:hypothetical protein